MKPGARNIALLLSAVVFQHTGATAATYYVDSVAGVDANNGTSLGTPWKSLTKVNAIDFLPGDQVLFKKGSSWTGTLTPKGNGSSSAQLVFDAYGTGAAPLINGGGGANAVMLWSKKYFTFQNFSVTNDAPKDGYRTGIRMTFVGPPSSMRVFPGVKILNNEIHHVRGFTVRSQGIYSTAALYVEMADAEGCKVQVQDLLVEGNNFHDNRCIGFNMKSAGNYGGRPELWATNFKIRQNIFSQGGADHIVINGAIAPLIEHNSGYDAGILATYPAASYIAGMWTCYYTKDAIFQFNEVARTHSETLNGASGDSQAFDADFGTQGNQIFQYNYTHDNDGGVLLMMWDPKVAKTVIYRYNLSVNDGRNTFTGCQFNLNTVFGKNSAYVYNNVLYTTRQEGFKFLDKQACYYYNNIFDMPAAIYSSKPVFSNNCYFGHTPDVTDPCKILADPMFVGPLPATAGKDGYVAANLDIFKLRPNSPCINAGMAIIEPPGNGGRDFWGNSLYAGGFPDIGAHEVVGCNRPAPAAVTITDNPASNSVIYTGSWGHHADPLWYNATKSESSAVGNHVEFVFHGTNASIFGHKGLGHGKLNVSVDDGAPVLVDCYSPVDRFRVRLYQISGLTNADHTLKATVAAKNPVSTWNTIGIDYFLQESGTPASSPVVSTWDNPPSAAVVYSGTWTAGTNDTHCWCGTKSTSSTVGDYVDFAFVGTGAGLYGGKAASFGKLSIAIDGGAATVVNCYQPTLPDYLVKLYEVNGLASGKHTMRATVATKDAASSANTVALDFFQSLDGGGPPVKGVVGSRPVSVFK